MVRIAWMTLVAVAACGSPAPRSGSPGRAAAPATTAAPPTAPPAKGAAPTGFLCPPAFADARQSNPACEATPLPRCAYPDGECWCGETWSCSGAEMPPGPIVWQCVGVGEGHGCPADIP